MKAYLVTTGVIFGLVVVAHVCRMFSEGLRLAADPFFAGLTLLSAGLSVWAWRLLRRLPRP